ncbi:MAG: glucosidase [Thermoanaerobaculia bacterium]
MSTERKRLEAAATEPWREWGPYLSERQWGTVREDYSANGAAWDYFPHEMAPARAYRWGEDGLAGFCDSRQRLCFALALWNGRDPILKERLFGLTGPQGNHGEDVKECYYYLDALPTSAYLKMLYKYPQAEFPYRRLVDENARRGRQEDELELLDTGAFDHDRYFDVFVEYAKATPTDILIRLTVANRGPESARLALVPQLWFRNTWSWGRSLEGKPSLAMEKGERSVSAFHPELGKMWLFFEDGPESLFCDNDTNVARLWGGENPPGFFKDGLHEALVHGRREAVNPERKGTKMGLHYALELAAGEERSFRLRLSSERLVRPFSDYDPLFADRLREADEFYAELGGDELDPEARRIYRQASAGLLWSKQFYHFDVPQWLEGDPSQPTPPEERKKGRNHQWTHLNNADVISMPDKWEYPWYAAWDLAFHCVPLARLDPDFAKKQLVLLAREWYMHPNGQLPAYEWAFGDVNPPVHAWAALRVFEIERELTGKADYDFLERVFHKLMLNFTWWVNRKDAEGRNVFQGGFLGLDNIGIFDRSAELPTGGRIDQADGTGWMAMYSLNLMRMALELAVQDKVYEDIATKFFEHFLYIAASLADLGGEGIDFWDEEDEFFYDVLHLPNGKALSMRVRSMVGLIPLFAVEVLEPEMLEALPEFRKRLDWFLSYRPDLAQQVSRWHVPGGGDRRLLSLLRGFRMKGVLRRLLDETEFLSPHGVRSISRAHAGEPYQLKVNGREFSVGYEPAESRTGLFGGNSNWRGPVWFPVNFLIIEALRRFHRYYGDGFQVECPTGSGRNLHLGQVADELSRRLAGLFRPDRSGQRPVFGDQPKLQGDPHFRDHLLFYEYFHGDTGQGLGASHQTGWTALVAELLKVPGRG